MKDCQGCGQFNVDSYRKRYVDLRRAFGNDLKQYYIHYMTNGKNEGRIGTGTTKLIDPESIYGRNMIIPRYML